MPYIPQKDRDELLSKDGGYYGNKLDTAGKLNFLLTILYLSDKWTDSSDLKASIWFRCLDYLENTQQNYQAYNDVMGALLGSKLEFKLRFYKNHPRGSEVIDAIDAEIDHIYNDLITPYEKKKIKKNGDVL